MPIQNLIALIAHYDPSFPHRIRGASPHRIMEIERLAGQPLPPSYREFLGAMGECMDWLQPGSAHFDVVSLLRYYTGESSRPPAGYLKIGLSDSDPFFDIYLEMGGAPEPRVISMPRQPGDDIRTCQKSFRHPLGGTLEEYLATSAYRTLRFNRLPNAIRLAGKDPMGPRLADVFPLLEPLGMKAFWFSNDWVQAFASRASGVIATQFPGGVLAIDLAATEPGMLEAIRQTLTQKLALPHAFTVKVAKPTHDAPLARLRERGGG